MIMRDGLSVMDVVVGYIYSAARPAGGSFVLCPLTAELGDKSHIGMRLLLPDYLEDKWK